MRMEEKEKGSIFSGYSTKLFNGQLAESVVTRMGQAVSFKHDAPSNVKASKVFTINLILGPTLASAVTTIVFVDAIVTPVREDASGPVRNNEVLKLK